MIIADCDVDETNQTIDGIKFPYDEFVRRIMRLINIEINDYERNMDELYDRKNKLD